MKQNNRLTYLMPVLVICLAVACMPASVAQVAPSPNANKASPVQPLPDAFSINGDSLASVRKGLLSYAVRPLPERQLQSLDDTPRGFSVTVPLTIDRDQNGIYIDALIDNKKIRLELDTGGDAGVTLNQPTAAGIALNNSFSATFLGIQGSEPATEGIAHSMTIGALTLRAIDTVVVHGAVSDRNANVLGTPIFANYRVTLDFAANTLTLSRGGATMTAAAGESVLSVPFRQSDDGQIYLAVHICGQSTWACLDTGSGLNFVSLTVAKAAAAQLPPHESVSTSTSEKMGPGGSVKGTKILAFKRPLPILLDLDKNGTFSTTTQLGASFYEDVINSDPTYSFSQGASLGLPFFLQFRRVIIDYPSHMLILQGRVHGDPLFTSKPGEP